MPGTYPDKRLFKADPLLLGEVARLRGISRVDVIASMIAEQLAKRFVGTTEVAGLIPFLAGASGSAITAPASRCDRSALIGSVGGMVRLRPVAWSSMRTMTTPPPDLDMAIRLPP